MKKKILVLLAVILVLGIAASGFALKSMSLGVSTGTALVTHNGSLMLIKDNSPIKLSFDTGKEPSENEFSTGDRILVFHNGINESYPASTFSYMCFNVGKGANEEIPEDVITSLTELGWLKESKTKETEEVCEFSEKYLSAGYVLSENEILPDFPLLNVLHTYEEIENFIAEKKSIIGFSDEALNEFSSYSREFFSENCLISLLFYEGSGSITHSVNKIVSSSENELTVFIDKNTPEVGTCDMALRLLLIEVKISDIGEKDIRLSISEGKKSVEMQKDYLNFSIDIPDGWEYEKNESSTADTVSIDIYKADDRENFISINAGEFFGVCGTGLKTKEITLGKNTATMGIYDNNPDWDFIILSETAGSYYIYNTSDDMWWKENSDEAMEILSTLDVAKGIISEKEAVIIAEKNVGEYSDVRADFDVINGIWTVTFTKEETEAVVTVSHDGELDLRG